MKLRAVEDFSNQVLMFKRQLCGSLKAGEVQGAAQDSEPGGGCGDGT